MYVTRTGLARGRPRGQGARRSVPWHHRPRERTNDHTAAGDPDPAGPACPDAHLRPMRRARADRCRTVRAVQPSRPSRLVGLAGPRHRDRRRRAGGRPSRGLREDLRQRHRAVRCFGLGRVGRERACRDARAVTNKGTSVGQTTCRVVDPADRTGSGGAIVLSPRIDPNQTRTFTVHVTELGTVAVPLDVACTGP